MLEENVAEVKVNDKVVALAQIPLFVLALAQNSVDSNNGIEAGMIIAQSTVQPKESWKCEITFKDKTFCKMTGKTLIDLSKYIVTKVKPAKDNLEKLVEDSPKLESNHKRTRETTKANNDFSIFEM